MKNSTPKKGSKSSASQGKILAHKKISNRTEMIRIADPRTPRSDRHAKKLARHAMVVFKEPTITVWMMTDLKTIGITFAGINRPAAILRRVTSTLKDEGIKVSERATEGVVTALILDADNREQVDHIMNATATTMKATLDMDMKFDIKAIEYTDL